MNVRRIVRGGSWAGDDGPYTEASSRFCFVLPYQHSNVGFRCALAHNALRIVRGGCWLTEDARVLRATYRFRRDPRNRHDLFGFRCATQQPPGSHRVSRGGFAPGFQNVVGGFRCAHEPTTGLRKIVPGSWESLGFRCALHSPPTEISEAKARSLAAFRSVIGGNDEPQT